MHQQIKTSPGHTDENLRRVADALVGVQVLGIGPDFESPHIRTVVADKDFEAAWNALKSAGLQPITCRALTYAVENQPGAIVDILEDLAKKGFVVESVLVLASRINGQTLVSFGVDRGIPPDWEDMYAELGGVAEPDDWNGHDTDTTP